MVMDQLTPAGLFSRTKSTIIYMCCTMLNPFTKGLATAPPLVGGLNPFIGFDEWIFLPSSIKHAFLHPNIINT